MGRTQVMQAAGEASAWLAIAADQIPANVQQINQAMDRDGTVGHRHRALLTHQASSLGNLAQAFQREARQVLELARREDPLASNQLLALARSIGDQLRSEYGVLLKVKEAIGA